MRGADRLAARGRAPSAPSRPAHRPPITSRSPDAGRQVVGRALAGAVVVAAGAGPQQPRPPGAERQDGDDGVVEPAHVGVAVERLTVAAVAVLDHAEPVELRPVAVLQGPGRLGRAGCGQGRPRRHPAPSRRSST